MKDQISKLLVKNPLFKLTRFRIFRILVPGLAAALLAWKDLQPLFSKDGALLAVFLVFVLMLCMVYAGNRFSDKVSASFLESVTTSKEGVACIRSLAITGVATLFVYTLAIWDVARTFGLMK